MATPSAEVAPGRTITLGNSPADALAKAFERQLERHAAATGPARKARTKPVHENRQFLHIFRAVRESLPGPISGGVRAGKGGKRNAANGAGQQEFEGIH